MNFFYHVSYFKKKKKIKQLFHHSKYKYGIMKYKIKKIRKADGFFFFFVNIRCNPHPIIFSYVDAYWKGATSNLYWHYYVILKRFINIVMKQCQLLFIYFWLVFLFIPFLFDILSQIVILWLISKQSKDLISKQARFELSSPIHGSLSFPIRHYHLDDK